MADCGRMVIELAQPSLFQMVPSLTPPSPNGVPNAGEHNLKSDVIFAK